MFHSKNGAPMIVLDYEFETSPFWAVARSSTWLKPAQALRNNKTNSKYIFRRNSNFLLLRLLRNSFILLLIFLSCCCYCDAGEALDLDLGIFTTTGIVPEPYIEASMIESPPPLPLITPQEDADLVLARLARSGTILVDHRPPPVGIWHEDIYSGDDELRRRATVADPAASTASWSISTLAPTPTKSSGIASPTVSSWPLPSAFDVGFNNNLTTSCQSFMNQMLRSGGFKSCLPLSMLLQNSNSFFQASKSLVRITSVLDHSCSADPLACNDLFISYISNITLPQNCAADLMNRNPQVMEAQQGLRAYRTLYTASCLRDPVTSSYCYANAITNSSSPSDSYVYFLPLNVSLVGGAHPTCNACTRNTMNVFQRATTDRKSAIATTYPDAAMQVNVYCGPSFANASLVRAESIAVVSGAPNAVGLWLWFLAMLLARWVF